MRCYESCIRIPGLRLDLDQCDIVSLLLDDIRPDEQVAVAESSLSYIDGVVLEELFSLLYCLIITQYVDICITLDAVVYLCEFSDLETTVRKRLQELVREVLVSVKLAVVCIVKSSWTFQGYLEG